MISKSGTDSQKLFVLWIVILMLGLIGIVNCLSVSLASSPDDASVEPDIDGEGIGSRGRAGYTEIPGVVQLWDYYNNEVHDGVYGDGDNGDNYKFYLDSKFTGYNSFSIQLKSIYDDGYLYNVNTELEASTEARDIIKIVDPYYNRSGIASNDWEYFEYDIEIAKNARIQSYELNLDVETDDGSGTLTFYLQLRSRIECEGSEKGLVLVGKDRYDNTEPIYSGAQNQIIALPNAYSGSSTLTDVSITLTPESSFTLDSNTITVDELGTSYYYSDKLEWMLTDAGPIDANAQKYYGTMSVNYKIGGTSFSELGVPIAIEIAETPIINLGDQISESDIGTSSGGKLVSNIEIYQGTTSETFSLEFKNEGNVDILNAEVELYTDNAAFFFKSNFYYDEGNQAQPRSYGKTISLGDIDVGKSIVADFPSEVIKNLPPGLYKIPILYNAKYKQEGGLFDKEFDVNDDHEEIVAARSTSGDGFNPFLLVNVIEGDDEFDLVEPDLQATTTTNIRSGMNSLLLEVELTNLENYRLNNVNAKIDAGGASPLQPLNEVDRLPTKIDAQETDFTMYGANDPYFSNKGTIHFLVDIFIDAASGIHEVPITVTCLDPYNQERTTMVKVPLNINPVPPYFVISIKTTGKIEPKKNFVLTVNAYNCGGSNAENVMLMFNGSSNLFSAEQNIQGPKDVMKNEGGVFTFNIKSGDVDPGSVYTSSIFISFEDSLGNIYSFDSNPEQSISLQINKEEKETGWDINNINTGLALVIFGLFILISAVALGFIWSRGVRRRGAPPAGARRTPPPEQRVSKPSPSTKGQEPSRSKFGKFGRKGKKDAGPGSAADKKYPNQTYSTQPPPPRPTAQGPPQQQYQPQAPAQRSYQPSSGWQQGDSYSPAPPPAQGPPPEQQPYYPPGPPGQYPRQRPPQQNVYY